jgi:large repetitive protein
VQRKSATALLWMLVALAVGAEAGSSGATLGSATSNPANTFAAASSFCDGTTEVVAADSDAHVEQAAPSDNFGGAVELEVASSQPPEGPSNRRSLLHFTLPPVPSHCGLTHATLRLNSLAAAPGRTIEVYRAGSAWTESGVTWANQPGVTGGAATALSASGWNEWDVTTLVDAFYTGLNDGFVVRDQTEGSDPAAEQGYQSREGAPDSQDPELALTFG